MIHYLGFSSRSRLGPQGVYSHYHPSLHCIPRLRLGVDGLQRAQAEAQASARRVSELETELQQLRAASGVIGGGGVMARLFQLPSKEDVLTGV